MRIGFVCMSWYIYIYMWLYVYIYIHIRICIRTCQNKRSRVHVVHILCILCLSRDIHDELAVDTFLALDLGRDHYFAHVVIMPTTFKARTGKHKLYKETSSTRNQLSLLRTVNVFSLSLVSVKLSRAQLLIHRLNATGQPIRYDWLGEKTIIKLHWACGWSQSSPKTLRLKLFQASL